MNHFPLKVIRPVSKNRFHQSSPLLVELRTELPSMQMGPETEPEAEKHVNEETCERRFHSGSFWRG